MSEKPMQQNSETLIDFSSIAQRIFTEHNGVISIGGIEIKDQTLGILREQAKYIQTSQFYEILHATVINEAIDLALNKSATFEHVEFAKALKYWDTIMAKMILHLAK